MKNVTRKCNFQECHCTFTVSKNGPLYCPDHNDLNVSTMPRDTSGEWKIEFDKFPIGETVVVDVGGDRDEIPLKLLVEDFIESLLSSQKELWLGRARECVPKAQKVDGERNDIWEATGYNICRTETLIALSSLSEGEE